MAKPGHAVSINPESFSEGGFVLSNARARVVSSRFVDPDSDILSGDEQVPFDAVWWRLVFEVKDAEEQPRPQYLLAANREDRDGNKMFVASDDGTEILVHEDADEDRDYTLRKTSDTAKAIGELIKAGYPAKQLQTDISVIEDMEVHVIQLATDRKRVDNRGNEVAVTIPVIDQIFSKTSSTKTSAAKGKGAKASAAGKGKKTNASAQAEDNGSGPSEEDVRAVAAEAIKLAADGLEEPSDIPSFERLVHSRVKDTKLGKKLVKGSDKAPFRELRNAAVALASDETFLAELHSEEEIIFDPDAETVGAV